MGLNTVLVLDINGNDIHCKYYKKKILNWFSFFQINYSKRRISTNPKKVNKIIALVFKNIIFSNGGTYSKKSKELQEHLHGEELMEHTYSSFESDSGKWGRL